MQRITRIVFLIAFTTILLIGVYLMITGQPATGLASSRYSGTQKVSYSGAMIILVDFIFLAIYLATKSSGKREYKEFDSQAEFRYLKRNVQTRKRI